MAVHGRPMRSRASSIHLRDWLAVRSDLLCIEYFLIPHFHIFSFFSQALVFISSVGFLHELRDVALTGELDRTLTAAPLIASKGLAVRIDRAQFCRMYEGSVLSLDK